MNADKFFEKYSIEEISQRTKISPISLRFIRNKEFEKIPRAKFFGFIKIIENEFNVDLSELKEEYNSINSTKAKKEKKEIKIEKEKNNYFITILAFMLLIIGGYILYLSLQNKNNSQITPNNNTPIIEKNITTINEENTTKEIISKEINTSKKTISQELNTSKKIIKPIIKKYPVEIIPHKLVWYRAKNIDTNKTFEYLTSKIKILPKGNYYIKFGHGNITINYANQTITPNTQKIVRILLKDGNYTFLKKPNRYEK